MQKRNRFVILGMMFILALCCTGCSTVNFSQALPWEKKSENTTKKDSTESDVLSALETVCSAKNAKELKELINYDFGSNTLSLVLDGKSAKEIKLYLEILQKLEFVSYKNEKLEYKAFTCDDIVNYLAKDYDGFVKDYNNFLALKMSEQELQDYVLDYLAQLFSTNDKKVEMTKQTCNLKVRKDGKLSSDTFLTQLANSILVDLPKKIRSTTFNPEPENNTAKILTSDFKIGKSKVMLYPVKDEKGNVISTPKILVTVDTIEKDQKAYEKLCSINQMNSSINVNYDENSLYYVHYTVENFSGVDLTYNDSFRLIDVEKNSYTVPTGAFFGLTPSSVLKNGSITSLDTVLIGPKEAKLGWYDSVNSYFYSIGGER